MRERGTQSRRRAEFEPDVEPVRPVRRPPGDRGPASSGGFWPVLAIVAIIVATAGWTTVAVMAFNGGGRAVAVASPDDSIPSDDPNASAQSDPPVELSHDAADIEPFLPTHVNDTVLTIQSWKGDAVLSDDDWSTSLTKFIASKNKAATDLEVATGYDDANENGPSVGVSRLAGIDGPALEAAIIAAWKVESPDMVVSTLTVDGKALTKGVFGEGFVDSYWYQRDDLVFDIETSDPTLLTAILASLPSGAAGSGAPSVKPSSSSSPSSSIGPSASAVPSASPAPSASPS